MKLDERRALRTEVSRFITASCLSAVPSVHHYRPTRRDARRADRTGMIGERSDKASIFRCSFVPYRGSSGCRSLRFLHSIPTAERT